MVKFVFSEFNQTLPSKSSNSKNYSNIKMMGNYGKIWFLRMVIAVYHIDLGYSKINGKMCPPTYVIQSLPSIPSLKIFQILQQQYTSQPCQY